MQYVTLTPAQRANHNAKADRWTQTLIQQARDASDPETQQNAQTLLRNRNITW